MNSSDEWLSGIASLQFSRPTLHDRISTHCLFISFSRDMCSLWLMLYYSTLSRFLLPSRDFLSRDFRSLATRSFLIGSLYCTLMRHSPLITYLPAQSRLPILRTFRFMDKNWQIPRRTDGATTNISRVMNEPITSIPENNRLLNV